MIYTDKTKTSRTLSLVVVIVFIVVQTSINLQAWNSYVLATSTTREHGVPSYRHSSGPTSVIQTDATLSPNGTARNCDCSTFRDVFVNSTRGAPLVEPSLPDDFGPDTLLFFVQSAPKNAALRHNIRNSWGNITFYINDPSLMLHVIFTMGAAGQTLTDEIARFGDLLVLDFVDSYENLTLKGLYSMQWIAEKVPTVKYIFKTDDDVLVNTHAWLSITRYLQTHKNHSTVFIAGWVQVTPNVLRAGRYAVSKEEYSLPRYPNFCSGSGYLMSREALVRIVFAARFIRLLKRDDPYLTGIIRQQLGISLVTVPKNTYLLIQRQVKENMVSLGTFMIAHRLTHAQWTVMWRRVNEDQLGRARPDVEMPSSTDGTSKVDPSYQIPNKTLACIKCLKTMQIEDIFKNGY